MSVVIIGGNECMVRQYKDICKSYQCQAKVYTKMHEGLKNGIGSPDLLIFFTGTTSHKMVHCATNHLKGNETRIERSHSSSISALKSILEKHA